MVECRTPEREVGGWKPTAAVLCPWARHFTPRKYWLITQEAVAPSRHDWKIVDWDVKPQHKQTKFTNQKKREKIIKVLYPNYLHILNVGQKIPWTKDPRLVFTGWTKHPTQIWRGGQKIPFWFSTLDKTSHVYLSTWTKDPTMSKGLNSQQEQTPLLTN